jgi:hypothetical protein
VNIKILYGKKIKQGGHNTSQRTKYKGKVKSIYSCKLLNQIMLQRKKFKVKFDQETFYKTYFNIAWFAIAIRETWDRFHQNFQVGFRTHLLGYNMST